MSDDNEKLMLRTRMAQMPSLRMTCGTAKRGRDEDGWEHDAYRVRLINEDRKMEFVFRKGTGHRGSPPSLEEVLDAQAFTAAGIESSPRFEDWVQDYGYDVDSRKAYALWERCTKTAAEFKALIGDPQMFDDLLYETERL